MKNYNEFESVEELFEAYNITPLADFLTEKKDDKKEAKKEYKNDKKNTDDPEKVVKTDKLEVIYSDMPKKFDNIFMGDDK